MTFRIYKTSDGYGRCRPHPKAYLHDTVETSWSTIYKENIWHIDIDSLENLLDLQKHYDPDPIIIDWIRDETDVPTIEIYDTYRE